MEKKENGKSVIPKIAKALGKSSVNSACALWYHQPKVPQTMKRGEK